MATDHRGNPINDNNTSKTNQDRIDEFPEEFSEGDTRSDELSAQHQKEDMSLMSDREDHSALLPSQHQTGKFYGY